MSGANATAKVTVKLLDQLSRPANLVRSALRGIGGDMASLKGANLGITKHFDEANARARELRSTLLGVGAAAVVAAYGLQRVMKPGTNFETTLTDIRQKAQLSAVETKKLGDAIKALAPTVNTAASKVAGAVNFLMGMGGISQDQIMGMMPSIGKTAAAYRAEITDIAKTSHSVFSNMKIPVDKMSKALDVMAQSGADGGFELKAMAQYLPAIFAMANNAKMTGLKGIADVTSAAQIIRESAGNEGDAATYLRNVLQKIESPETRKKFKKVGIDISKEIEAGQKAGVSPLETLAVQTKKALSKKGVKIGDLFEDQQVSIGILALIDKLERFREISKKALEAEGVVDRDYKIRMETFQSVIDRTSQAFEKLAVTIGESLMPLLTTLADKLGPLVSGIADWVSANQTLASNALAAAGALLALAGVVATIKLLGAGLSVFGLKGIRGLLNHLAPKVPGTAAATAATGAAAKVAATAATSGTGAATSAATGAAAKTGATVATANKARVMTAAELHAASKGTAAVQAGHAAKVAAALGEVGPAASGLLSKSLILVSRMANIASLAEITFRALEAHSPTTKENSFTRLDPNFQSELERSRRVQDERKRDPEGARGRAMADRDRYAAEADVEKSRAGGEAAGAAFSQGLAAATAAAEAAFASTFDRMISGARAKLAGANLSVNVTPSMAGGGAALRAIHSDMGIN